MADFTSIRDRLAQQAIEKDLGRRQVHTHTGLAPTVALHIPWVQSTRTPT